MTDREYLELAAKVAGLRVGFEPDGKERGRYDLYWSNVHHQLVWHGKSVGSEYPRPIFWNPLTDDGDALRLAVKLEMCIDFMDRRVIAGASGPEVVIDFEDNDYRRAIVRAAAEIGRSMT